MRTTIRQTHFNLSRPPSVHGLSLITAAIMMVSFSAHSATYSARNAAMGGVGVASSTYDTAASSNAALLTRFSDDDDFSLVLPAIGIEGSDEFEVLDTLGDISDDYDLLELQINSADLVGALNSRDQILADLEAIDEQPIRADFGALVGFAKPSKTLAVAVEARARIDLFAYTNYIPTDAALINLAIFTADETLLDDIQSSTLAFGVATTELSVSFATEFNLGVMDLALGVSPKYQSVETILYNATVKDFDEDDIDADQYREDDSNINFDVGVALSFGDSLTVGLQISDLIEESYDTVVINGYTTEYTIESTATAGVAWQGDWVTLAFDLDLNERKPFDEIDGSRFARAGVEFDVFGWLQLRAGVRQDLENTREDLLTAGIGISPFNTFHVDLTAVTGDNDTYGGALDLRWTF